MKQHKKFRGFKMSGGPSLLPSIGGNLIGLI